MMVQVRMPGSCGELVQGVMEGTDFHITCPIDRYSRVSASFKSGGELKVPEQLDKTATAVKKALEMIESDRGIEIDVRSELPQGKGMASSTADIAAALAATFRLLERDIGQDDIAKIAVSIEPTDGTFFNGLVSFDHINGRRLELLGEAPPIEIIVLEPPEMLDTVIFNKEKRKVDNADESMVAEAYEMAVAGIKTWDAHLVGKAATMSAILNQKLLCKKALEDVMDVCRLKGGIGVNVAHSGTVMGMLAEKGFGRRLFEKVSHYVPSSWNAYLVDLIDGGVQYDEFDPVMAAVSQGIIVKK